MSTPGWYLDELEHAGSEHLDPEYVAGYDRKAGTDPAHDLALLRRLGLNERHTLVDLGTGTGTLPLIAAPYCRRVVAVDVSAPMLGLLEERAAKAGIENIECVRAGFLSYEHEGEPADVVYSRHALHHLPDFWKVIALRRIADMLKPGGVFHFRDLFFSVEPDEIADVVERWLSGAAKTPEAGWTRGTGDVPAGGAQRLHVANRVDAGAGGFQDPGAARSRFEDLRRVHVREALEAIVGPARVSPDGRATTLPSASSGFAPELRVRIRFPAPPASVRRGTVEPARAPVTGG